jgi:chromosome segregation ATPase
MAQSDAELELTIKELKVRNEDLKSTNEDLKSTNEDLKSTNEDLKSTNEDLESTIKDLERKMEELVRHSMTNYLKEESNYANLSGEIKRLETELCMIEQDRDSDADLAREKLTECQRNCANLQKEYDYRHNRDNFELRQEIDEKTLTIDKLLGTIDKLLSQIVDCQSQIGIIHANTEAAEAEHASKRLSAEAAFAELTSDYNALQVDYNLHRDKVIKEPEGGALLWNDYRTSQKGLKKTIPELQAGYAAQWPGGKRPDKKTNSTNIM